MTADHTVDNLPDWNTPGAFSAGRDPLGLQAASVRLYTGLLPGLTNVTNRLRYFSFYCWVVRQFELRHHSAAEDKWRIFIRRAEAIYVLASRIGDDERASGMAGSNWASDYLDLLPEQEFDFSPWTDRPGKPEQYLKAPRGNFGQFYVASMLEMGMLEEHTAPVYAVTENYGLQLATAFEKACPKASKLLFDAIETGAVTRESCEMISEETHPSLLREGSDETRLLREYLWGERETDPTARARRASLWNIMSIIKQTNLASANDLRRELYVQDNTASPADSELTTNLQSWRAYMVNELCHIALELLLNALAHCVNGNSASSIDKIAQHLVSAYLKQVSSQARPIADFAQEVALPDLLAEHELGHEISDIVKNNIEAPNAGDIDNAVKLLLSLWNRWGTDKEFVRVLHSATVSGRSAAGIFEMLDRLANEPAGDALAALIRKFVISNHLLIAGQKLSSSGTFTYRFIVDEGQLVDGVPAKYDFTTPRIGNLIRFAEDARLLGADSEVTEVGKAFLRAVQPI